MYLWVFFAHAGFIWGALLFTVVFEKYEKNAEAINPVIASCKRWCLSFFAALTYSFGLLISPLQETFKSKPEILDLPDLVDPCSTRMVEEAIQRAYHRKQQFEAIQKDISTKNTQMISKATFASMMSFFFPSAGFVRLFQSSDLNFESLHILEEPLALIPQPEAVKVPELTPIYICKTVTIPPKVLELPAPEIQVLEEPVPQRSFPNAENLLDHLPKVVSLPLRFTEYTFDSATSVTAAGIKFVFRL